MQDVHLIESLRRAFRWRRRTFAAILVAVAVLAGLNALGSPDAAGVPVVTASRPVAAGTALTASDLVVATLPAALVPEGSSAVPDAVIGQQVVVNLPAHTVVTASLLLGEVSGAAAGNVALPVRFAEAATVTLLRTGARIDVLGPTADGAGYGVVAGNVRVAAIPSVAGSGLLDGAAAPVVLLDVNSTQAAAIVGAATVSSLSFALR